MNAQNHEQDKLINLLVATSQDRDSHTIRTHLENRFGDSEVCEAVIAYSSAIAETKASLGLQNDSKKVWGPGKRLINSKID